VAGSKLQLRLLAHSKVPLFLMDASVFANELVTALLIRVMLLSIPDENTAVLMTRTALILKPTKKTRLHQNTPHNGQKEGRGESV
jgi:hypothetical protein